MAKQQKVAYPKRGEVYLVNFDPTIGSEIQKTRPALILQNDIANQHSPITIVAAITSQFDKQLVYPTVSFYKSSRRRVRDKFSCFAEPNSFY
jgi:mRNA interferase MazF